jgi:hypothetical protein
MAKVIDNIELDETNKEFNYASDFVKHTDKLVYLTGKAGTGKTTFLKYLKEETSKNTVILAPTGVAAINAGGQTIHSFFKIPFGPFIPNDNRLRTSAPLGEDDRSTIYNHFQYDSERLEIIRGLELLIIDEISMVRCDLLDVIDKLLKVYRRNFKEPFGGVQVILIGDTFQLPPIAVFEQWEILKNHYESPFFFSSKVIEINKPVYIELKKIYRQNEQEFIDLLNRIRVNEISEKELHLLNSKYNPVFSPEENSNYITLATHNRLVDSTNLTKLDELKTELKSFEATITGTFPESIMPTDRVLHLKEGAQIMFIKNDKTRRYYNGKIAKISKIEESKIIVAFSDENEITIEKQEWNNVKYKWNEKEKKIEEEIIGKFIQFPIKLAWAITVHKSQGLTFDKVIADLGAAFTPGQVYVALSRCTSFNGLVLKSQVTQNAIKTDPKVLEFAKNETPNTLIVQELNSGKADFYYKKARDNFKSLNFSLVYDNFIKAIKFRNDIETDVFKKYFVTTARKITSYKTKYNSLLHNNQEEKSQNTFLQSKIDELENINSAGQIKNTEQNNAIKLLLEKTKELEEKETNYLKVILELKKEIKNSQELINNHKKNEIESYDTIFHLNQKIKSNETEIDRLKNLKWYHKLLGNK